MPVEPRGNPQGTATGTGTAAPTPTPSATVMETPPAPAPSPTPPLTLPGWGKFTDTAPKRRMIIALSAAERTGKTSWPISSGPEPVFVFGMDPNTEDATKKVMRETGRDIRYERIEYPVVATQQAGRLVWDRIEALTNQVVKGYDQGTLVYDTETVLKRICDLAWVGPNFQMAENVRIARSQERNEAMTKLIRCITDSGMSGVFIQKLAPKWKDDKPTGELEPKGWGELNYAVKTVMRFWHQVGAVDGDGNAVSPFQCYVGNNADDMSIAGMTFSRGPADGSVPSVPEWSEDGWPSYLTFAALIDLTFGK